MFTDVSVFMRFVAKDRVGWSVCVCVREPSKMAEKWMCRLGGQTRVGPGNHVLDEDVHRRHLALRPYVRLL